MSSLKEHQKWLRPQKYVSEIYNFFTAFSPKYLDIKVGKAILGFD